MSSDDPMVSYIFQYSRLRAIYSESGENTYDFTLREYICLTTLVEMTRLARIRKTYRLPTYRLARAVLYAEIHGLVRLRILRESDYEIAPSYRVPSQIAEHPPFDWDYNWDS